MKENKEFFAQMATAADEETQCLANLNVKNQVLQHYLDTVVEITHYHYDANCN